ncbi:hypothetical protein YC2023_100023 [Brassica napus]
MTRNMKWVAYGLPEIALKSRRECMDLWIKPFVVRLGVKVRMTSFPARPLRSGFYVEVIRRVAADGIYMGVEGRLRVVIS